MLNFIKFCLRNRCFCNFLVLNLILTNPTFMKKLLLILIFLASTSVFAQRITITGTVSDEKGAPLPGTTVQVKGTTTGTTTDSNGKYSVE